MKKWILKIRILLTNISRVIMSFLFINLNFSFLNKVYGVSLSDSSLEITCYDAGPEVTCYADSAIEPEIFTLKNVLIVLVPIVIVVVAVILIMKKRKKNKSKEDKKEDVKKD